MRIGLQIPRFTWPGGTSELRSKLSEIAKAAEKAGFYSIWVMDHFFQLPMIGAVDEPMLEGYSALNYLAAITQHVKLGTLVTGVVYRHPGALIKSVTTLDVLSGGRAYFGIGAAWFKQEAVGLGLPFPSTNERFERLEETLQIAKLLWADKREPFNGKHYQLAEPICSPQPISKPYPPILIGGGGEKKTLRFVAKYANACNIIAFEGNRVIKEKLKVLKKHCVDINRPYNEIERTVLSMVNISQGNMTGSDVIKTCRKLADIGIQQVIFNMPNVHDITPLDVFGEEIIPSTIDF
ncbi:hypothetical protein LCGC14_0599970 [marine sediment metagenome]|uniref:Luciferase-like domain-containing protein n=1 Tax=marine sediment metagenome TaxID=412755 RepID=A0A0F9RFP0_9ZZZZ